jgi:acetyltransferase
MEKDGIVIITNAGGLGVMSADATFDAKYIHAIKLKPETVEEIKVRVPTVAGLTNPIDVRGDAKPEYFREVIETVVKDPEVGGLVVMGSPLDTADLENIARMLVDMKESFPVPVTFCFAGGEKCERASNILREGGLACFPTPDRAVRALDNLRKHNIRSHMPATPMEFPAVSNGRAASEKIIAKAKAEGRNALTESEGKEIFAAYGIPTPGEALVNSPEEAAAACDKIGYPVVMKIISPDIQHKTDVGGVVVGVKDEAAARASYNKIMESCAKNKPDAKLLGVSIQQMVSGKEVILSMIRDPQYGPVISFGLGGIFVEILREISQAHVPMTEEQLDEMIQSTKAYKLMSGARGMAKSDITAMKDTIRKIVKISVECPEIKELEINPVIVGDEGKGCWAVDALVTLI